MKFTGTPLSRLLHACLFALLLPLGLGAAPLSLNQLHAPPSLALPKVSPSGRFVALRAEIDEVQYLALMDAVTTQIELSAKFEKTRLINYIWKGENLLLMIIANSDGSQEVRTFDLVTKKVTFLSEKYRFKSARVVCLLVNEPEDLVLEINSVNGVYLARQNVRTGKLTVIEKTSSALTDWVVDRKGHPFAAQGSEEKRRFIQWRPDPTAPWQRRDIGQLDEPGITLFGLHPDQKRLLAWDRSGDRTAALVALDPATMAKEVLLQGRETEIDEVRFWAGDPTALYGFYYEEDRPNFFFIDQEAAQLQAAIDRALPDTFNDIVSTSADHTVLAIRARSDSNPGNNYIFNRRTGSLISYGPSYPEIKPAEMGRSRPFAFKNRDGMTIHGRLLLPPGNHVKPPVLVSIGPWLAGPRSSYDFNVENQVFATRGYAIAQIDYRGMYGFGRGFLKAGDYQFSSGMPDDVLDGIDFITNQGWVDRDRVGLLTNEWGAIVGLQALIKSELFKVWVNDSSHLTGTLDIDNLARSDKKKTEIFTDLGGKDAAKKYLQSLDPKVLLPKIRIPSFHFYESAYRHGSIESADLVAKSIKSPSPLPEIVKIDPPLDEKPAHGAEYKAREKMFEFLAKWLPLAAPAK